TGEEAKIKREELEKLPASELEALLANQENFVQLNSDTKRTIWSGAINSGNESIGLCVQKTNTLEPSQTYEIAAQDNIGISNPDLKQLRRDENDYETHFSNGVSAQKTRAAVSVQKQQAQNPPEQVAPPEPADREEMIELTKSDLGADINAITELYYSAAGNMGHVEKGYDAFKNLINSDLGTDNVSRLVLRQQQGLTLMRLASEGELTKREYYELKDMILLSNTQKILDGKIPGLSSEALHRSLQNALYDIYFDGTTRRPLEAVMQDISEFETLLDNVDFNDTTARTDNNLMNNNFMQKLQKNAEQAKFNAQEQTGGRPEFTLNLPARKPKSPEDISQLHSAQSSAEEIITFEEVFRTERGVEFKTENVDTYEKAKIELNLAVSAYDKVNKFKRGAKDILYAEQIFKEQNHNKMEANYSQSSKNNAAADLFTDYYGSAAAGVMNQAIEELGYKDFVQAEIDESGKVELTFKDNMSKHPRNNFLSELLSFETAKHDIYLDNFLDINKIKTSDDYAEIMSELLETKGYEQETDDRQKALDYCQKKYERTYKTAFGDSHVRKIVEQTRDDNCTVVDRVSTVLMGTEMTVMAAGGILVFTGMGSVAGAAMCSAGGKALTVTMAVKDAAKLGNAYTKAKTDEEEISAAWKETVTDTGFLGVGMGAGKVGSVVQNKSLKWLERILSNEGSKAAEVISINAGRVSDVGCFVLANTVMTGDLHVSLNDAAIFCAGLGHARMNSRNNAFREHAKEQLGQKDNPKFFDAVWRTKKGVIQQQYIEKYLSGGIKVEDIPATLRTTVRNLAKQYNPEQIREGAAQTNNPAETNVKPQREIDEIKPDVTKPQPAPEVEKSLTRKEFQKAKSNFKKEILKKRFPKNTVDDILQYTNEKNIELAEMLCKDPEFLENRICNILSVTTEKNIELAKIICQDKEFLKERIRDILHFTTEKNIELAKIICQDKEFPKNRIFSILSSTSAENLNAKIEIYNMLRKNPEFSKGNLDSILRYTNEKNIELVRLMCENKDFSTEQIRNILHYTNEKNIELARLMCEDKDFPKEEIRWILQHTNETNMELARLMCENKDFPREHINDILRYTNEKNIALAQKLFSREFLANGRMKVENIAPALEVIDRYNPEVAKLQLEIADKLLADEFFNPNLLGSVLRDSRELPDLQKHIKMFENEQLSKWAVQQFNQDFSLKEVDFLAKTKRKLLSENNKPQEQNTNIRTEQYSETAKFEADLTQGGVEPKQAGYIIKACEKDGRLDPEMQAAAKDLLELEVSPKEIGEILNLAKVNGEFKPEIAEDFANLKDSGLNLMLRKNLAAINNMSAAEVTKTFNPAIKKQMQAMIEKIPAEQLKALQEKGIDTNGIIDKLENRTRVEVSAVNNTRRIPKREIGRPKTSIGGVERIILEKYIKEVPENVWRNPEKFKEWAQERIAKVIDFEANKDYEATTYRQINQNRKDGIEQWHKYLTEESTIKDDPFAQLMVLEDIVKDLKPDNAAVPPALSPVIFEQIFNAALQRGERVSFSKAYAEANKNDAMSKFLYSDKTVDGIEGKWITIPQTKQGSPDYKENVGYVQSLSEGTNWCIRFSMAETYIQQGNINFFVDANGRTQVCVRESSGEIAEIQKRAQDATVPVPYVKVIDNFVKEKNLHGCEGQIQRALDAKPEFDAKREAVAEYQAKDNYIRIFDIMGIRVEHAADGSFILSHYKGTVNNFRYTAVELGINENRLLQNVSEIKGSATFEGSGATTLKNLKRIGGKFEFNDSRIEDVRNLEEINGRKINWD
ncbi:MAG: hypothetical protein LBK53_04020, partial [Heliobacteriaceae bacterium]|nr:hypothetical protein [Heliobacteriaceae bacterium]